MNQLKIQTYQEVQTLDNTRPKESFKYRDYLFEMFNRNNRDIAWAVHKQNQDGSTQFQRWMRLPITTRVIAVVKQFDRKLGE